MSSNTFLNQPFVVIDVATTGFRPDIDSVVEVAAVKIQNGAIISSQKWRVNPGVSIPPAASAHHEIRDSDVVGCPTIDEVESNIKDFVGASTIIMHNLSTGESLDYALLPFLHDNTWICSARLAKHIYPQMTEKHGQPLANYDVWTLLYWMKLSGLDTFGAQVYEPLANAAATALVFQETLKQYVLNGHPENIPSVVELSEKPVAYPLMPRGPYKNCYMSDLPEEYLKSLVLKIRNNPDKSDKDYIATIETAVESVLQARHGSEHKIRRF